MKTLPKFISAAVLVAAVIGACAPAPDASDAHFAVVNNDDYYYPLQGNNFGTVLKLEGPKTNPVLGVAASLTTETLAEGDASTPQVQVVKHGSDVCVFLQDGVDASGANQISSFKFPSTTLVGNYTDSNVPSFSAPSWIVASGGYLFVSLVGTEANIATWGVGAGCTLSLLQTTAVKVGFSDAVATPNGAAIITSGGEGSDSLLIGPNGSLTEAGPYPLIGGEDGMDVTADSQYVIFGASGCVSGIKCYSAVIVVGINPDGSLNSASEKEFGGDGSLGKSQRVFYVHLSPDEKFLYSTGWTDDGATQQEISFNFTENPLNLTYTGCTTNLNLPRGQIFANSLATASVSGAGGALYIAESNEGGSGEVALLHVDPTTGCAVEAPESPFTLSDPHAAVSSIVAWPSPAVLGSEIEDFA